jgi:hypothetical protein
MFDDLFPPRYTMFCRSTLGAERWFRLKYGEGVSAEYSMILEADDLLDRALSWYESYDLFSNPRFLLKLSVLRKAFSLMAGNNSKDKKSAARPSWQGFIDFRLGDDQLTELDEWQPSSLEVFEAVDGILLSGYRLTVSYNPQTKLATCTIIDDDKKRPSGGYGLSTADVNSAAALKAAVYKHSLVLQGDWSSLLDKPSQGGRRG